MLPRGPIVDADNFVLAGQGDLLTVRSEADTEDNARWDRINGVLPLRRFCLAHRARRQDQRHCEYLPSPTQLEASCLPACHDRVLAENLDNPSCSIITASELLKRICGPR